MSQIFFMLRKIQENFSWPTWLYSWSYYCWSSSIWCIYPHYEYRFVYHFYLENDILLPTRQVFLESKEEDPTGAPGLMSQLLIAFFRVDYLLMFFCLFVCLFCFLFFLVNECFLLCVSIFLSNHYLWFMFF